LAKRGKEKKVAEEMRYDFFISYQRHDASVARVASSLTGLSRPDRVFWDHQIQPGEKWETTLIDAVRASSKILLIHCCHSAKSEWVAKEIELGLAEGKPIIPLLLCSYPTSQEVSRFQWIDGRGILQHQCTAEPHLDISKSGKLEAAAAADRASDVGYSETPSLRRVRAPAPAAPRSTRFFWWVVLVLGLVAVALVIFALVFWSTWSVHGLDFPSERPAFGPIFFGAVLVGLALTVLALVRLKKARIERTEMEPMTMAEAIRVIINLEQSGHLDSVTRQASELGGAVSSR